MRGGHRLTFAAGLLSCVLTISTGWADATTDRMQDAARAALQKPHRKVPYPCSPFASSGKDRYVVDMTPRAAAAGLRYEDLRLACMKASLRPSCDAIGAFARQVASVLEPLP